MQPSHAITLFYQIGLYSMHPNSTKNFEQRHKMERNMAVMQQQTAREKKTEHKHTENCKFSGKIDLIFYHLKKGNT